MLQPEEETCHDGAELLGATAEGDGAGDAAHLVRGRGRGRVGVGVGVRG